LGSSLHSFFHLEVYFLHQVIYLNQLLIASNNFSDSVFLKVKIQSLGASVLTVIVAPRLK